MWSEIGPGFRLMLVLTVLTGLIYPAITTGLSAIIFPRQAKWQLCQRQWEGRGIEPIGQNFSKPEYFHSRPSSVGSGYDATQSGGSNLGPTSGKLLRGTTKIDDKKNEVVDFEGINLRIIHYCLENDVPYESSMPLDGFKNAKGDLDDVRLIKAFNDDKTPLQFRAKEPVPADALTASASGLDPHISPANAQIQAARELPKPGMFPRIRSIRQSQSNSTCGSRCPWRTSRQCLVAEYRTRSTIPNEVDA